MKNALKPWAVMAGLTAAALVGCKKEEPTATPPPAKPSVSAPANLTGPGPAVAVPTTKPATTTMPASAGTAKDAGLNR